jgi:hypothetical protein
MAHHYGYIKGTKSIDGEHMDVFVKPGTPQGHTGPVFVVDQIVPGTGKPDEHKVMLGFDTIEDAKDAYHANYAKDWKGLKTISATPFAEFKQWLATGDTSKPFHTPSLRERADAMKARSAAPAAESDETKGKHLATVATPATPEPVTVTTPEPKNAPPPEGKSEATSPATAASVEPEPPEAVGLGAVVKHTTGKGKDIFGYVLHDATDAEARAIDPYTFNKDGGKFIRERHAAELEQFLAKKGASNAPQQVGEQGGGQREHPNRDEGGQAAEASGGDRTERAAPGASEEAKPAEAKPVGEGEGQPKSLKERADAMKERSASTSLTAYFADKIVQGNMPKDNPALRKMVEQYDRQVPTPARMKEAQEMLEAAIVGEARRIVGQKNVQIRDVRSAFDALLKLYESQPLLNVRTSTSIENQAYSTPAPLALLASELAGITRRTSVFEPTAGTGMLVIAADKANTKVNEFDPLRAQLLREQGFTVTTDDATKPILPAKSVERVIANPPFGPIKDDKGESIKVKVDGYTIGQIDHLISARALDAMQDDGRATLIIGANQVPGGISNNDLVFFNWLYGNYNVTSHFEADGKLYTRQGAGWPVRIITIEGREKSSKISPAAGVIQRAMDWEQVYGLYEQGLATGRAGRGLRAGPVSTSATTTDDTRPVPQPAGGEAPAVDRREPKTGKSSDANVGGERAGPVDDSGAVSEESVGSTDRTQRPGDSGVRPDRLGGEPGATRTAKPTGDARTPGLTDPDNQFQASYVARSSRKDTGVLIPVNMQQPTQDALSALEDAVGDIDEYARKQLGYESVDDMQQALMGLQVDSVASAIHQIGREKGTIIADQTGIGKGRQAAAIIRWAVRQGRIPVFMSAKPSLFTDMFGDLHDIGTDDVAPLIMNSGEWISGEGGEKLFANKPGTHKKTLEGIAQSGMLPAGRNALFSTYSQINVDNTQRQAMLALAPRAIFILDESHNAGGDSATGDFIKSALDLGKGVVYLSATYAKRPDNMPLYFKTDMGEAVADDETLLTAMEAGGLPLQTVVSNNLVKAGQMFRRERSYDGVEILTVNDTANRAAHEKLSDTVTLALRSIMGADRMFHEIFFKALQKEMEKEGGRALDNAGNQVKQSVDHTEFSSVVHNFVRQMLLGLEADNAANEAIAALQRGQKPLIALENTMGSFLSAYAEANNVRDGDALGTFDYRNVLSRALERSRVLTKVLPNGDKVKVAIPLSQLDPLTLQAYTRAQETIDGLHIDIPVSPIDWMRDRITKAGFTVAEITGRTLTVDYTNPKTPTLAHVDPQEKKDKVRTTRMFNSGKLDAIILNVSGSTGISLHASEKFTDQRQRLMIVVQAAQDINIFMQMLGRIHRTGQVALPSYKLLNPDLPAVKRPTALLSKKMKSLNANTSSNTESATSVKTLDLLNKYGDSVVEQYLSDNPMVAMEMGLSPSDGPDDEGAGTEDIARRATGRAALLPIATQREFYADIEAQYETLIDYLNKTNQNDLEPRTFDFDAREMKSQTIFEGQNQASPFGQDAVYNEYSIKAQGKPMTPKQLREHIAESLGEHKTGAQHAAALTTQLRAGWDKFYGSLSEAQQAKANAARVAGAGFIADHPIGSMFQVAINDEPYIGIVTNLRSTHKETGNPFSMSKIQVTLAVNGALRTVTVPGSRFGNIETGRIPRGDIDRMFKEGPADERQTAKIITGNLLAAYGELQSVRGTIISFTKEDGTIEQGILLPKAFAPALNLHGDFRLPSGEAAALFLQRSINKDIGRFGISTRDGIVRVTPDNGEIRISVPKSKAKGGKFFLDDRLRAVMGDFVSVGERMVATVAYRDAPAALDALMKKQALYTLPSMASEARDVLGLNLKPGTAAVERLTNPDRVGQRQATVAPTSSAMKNASSAADWLTRNGTQSWVREVSSKLAPFLDKDASITFLKAGDRVALPTSVAGVFKRGGTFGLSEVDPVTGRSSLYMRYDAENLPGQEDLLHELVHSATQRALSITKSATIRAELESIRTVLGRTFDAVLTSPRANDQARNDAEFFRRVISDEDELLAYGMTSNTFRKWAQSLDATGRLLKTPTLDQGATPVLTLWQRFVDVVRQLLGLSKMFQPRLDALLSRREAARIEFRTANTPETLARRLDTLLQQTLDLGVGAAEYNAQAFGGQRAGTAYHGTPHQFDAFSLASVGTGEGAQAYGYGLYFASRKEVAEHYRNVLGGMDIAFSAPAVEQRAKLITNFDDHVWGTIRQLAQRDNDPAAVAAAIRKYTERFSSGRETLNELAGMIKSGDLTFKPAGNLYEVTIPDDHEFLDWDKPLSEQSPFVQAKLMDSGDYAFASEHEVQTLADRMLENDANDWADEHDGDPVDFSNNANPDKYYEKAKRELSGIDGGMLGKKLYRTLMKDAGYSPGLFDDTDYQIDASNALRDMGIAGIRYLDASSRTSEANGTYNYVVFDDSRVGINQRLGTSAIVPDAGFMGYLAPNGKFESFTESQAEKADFHHSYLVKDLAAYDAEGGLTFVRMGGEPIVSIKGTPAMDPYAPKSSVMLSSLARRMIADGADPSMPFKVEDMGFKRAEAPYQGKEIGTLGEWSQRNMPRTSIKAGTADIVRTIRNIDQTQARNLFLDAVTSHGSTNIWQRTIGTQYAKAEANPTTFKPVFNAVQDYIKDTSVFANAAANEAPNILPKLDSLADLKRKTTPREDIDAAGKAAFEGTLKWARDENGVLRSIDDAQAHADTLTTDQKARELFRAGLVTEAELKRWQATPLDIYDGAVRNRYEQKLLRAGVVFSDAELKQLFKATPTQIKLYREFRNAIDQSLDDLGRTELVRLAGTTGAAVAKRAVAADTMADTAAILSEHIDALTEGEQNPVARDALTELRNSINDKANQVARLKTEGYAPLMRFGEHTVHVTQGGETVYFGLYETGMAANKAARALRDEFRGAQVVQGKMSQEAFKLYQGLDLNALELFAEATGNADNAVYQDFLRLTKNNRSAMKRMIERKGISGFNENTARVLASFVTSNARMASGNLHMGVALRAANAIPKEMGDLKDEATKLIKYVQNPGEEASAARALLFTNFIGGSIASALVNLTQPFTMSLPYLSQFGGAINAGKHLLAATRAAAGGTATGEVGEALRRAEQDGIVSPQEIHHLQSAAQARFADNPVAKKLAFLWGSMFSLSEQFNRRVTFIAAYQSAKEQGNADPFAFAEKAVIETQGLYNKGNKANWSRGAIGATVMTFKQFSVHYLEFLNRMWKSGPEGKKAVTLALAIMVLTAGAGGLPFADDLDDLIDTLAQAMGYDFSSKKAKRRFVAVHLGLGEEAAQFLTRGLSGISGMPIDVSLRMGMGNLLPGTGALLRSNTDRSRDVLEFAGAAGSLAKSALDAGTLALQGKFAQAGLNVAPLAVQNMAKAADMFNTGEYRNAKGQKVINTDMGDVAAKFIGFNPATVATESQKQQEVQRSVQLAKNVESEIAAKWAQGLNENRPELTSEARADLAEWNSKNPESQMRISMQQIIQRVRDMRASRSERTIKSAPREMRQGVREALQ